MGQFLKLIALGALSAVLTLIVMMALPHAPYVRWQAVRTEAFARLGWIYERVHDDRTPIDIAFIGTSHSLNGIDAAAIAKGLGEAGLRSADGRCPTATNLAIPSYGRNLHYEIAKEALENRRVGLLVIEVLENETRKPHPLFAQVATIKDVVTAPALININYAKDVARLPFRQLMLALKTAAPRAYGLKPAFDPADYDGSTVDNVHSVNVGGVEMTPLRDFNLPAERLNAKADGQEASKNLNYLPQRFERFEYAVPDRYMKDMLALAKEKGVRVVFLYLPGYRKPAKPFDTRLYDGHGDMLFPITDLTRDPSLWVDPDHLNIKGAQILTERLPAMLIPELEATGWKRDGEAAQPKCDAGYPPRAKLLPFRKAPHHG